MSAKIHTATGQETTDMHSLSHPATLEPVGVKPFYNTSNKGVFYVGVKTEGGEAVHKPPEWLADAIHLIGRGVDTAGSHYRIIEWRDKISRQTRIGTLEMGSIGTLQGWRQLQSMGITVLAARRKRELLADYLQTEGSSQVWEVVNKAGWCNSNRAYILPSGEVLTAHRQSKNSARIIYNGDTSQAAAYRASGSLDEWQQHIARHMAGNSRLCLAIGTALAAPLVSLLGMEAGGFHLFGDSRDGKSTAARAALSVWGNPEALMLTWTGTGHGFANTANARNDNLLVLDEIGQAQPRHVSQTAYSVINGVSKIQGAKEGGNREISRWRVLLLSTGEKPLDGFLQAARTDWNAGQAARLPSVPSDAGKGHGIYDTLHGHPKGSALSEALAQAASQHHGHAGRALVQLLLNNPASHNEARQIMADFMATLPDMDGQARTVAMRFALVAAALELAARHRITGLAAGICLPAIKQCFDAWLERNGSGKYEDQRIIENAIGFMQQFAHSSRFAEYPGGAADRTPADLAGYRKLADHAAADLFYILPPVFVTEICKDYDKGKVCQVLFDAAWLKRYDSADKSRWQHQLKGKGRFFVLMGALPPDEMQD